MANLFKDRHGIQRPERQAEFFREMIDAVERGELHDLLFRGARPDRQRPHDPDHSGCGFKKSDDAERTTEKRMCRCMFYVNTEKVDGKGRLLSRKCHGCNFRHKWELVADSGYSIEDYEVPSSFVIENVGGVDLLVRDSDGVLYAVEMKPSDSDESMARMVAEILTYHDDDKFRESCTPAIGFFDRVEPDGNETVQSAMFEDLEASCDEFKRVMSACKIAALRFSETSYDEDRGTHVFSIERIDL